jgi:hypothetical protein
MKERKEQYRIPNISWGRRVGGGRPKSERWKKAVGSNCKSCPDV